MYAKYNALKAGALVVEKPVGNLVEPPAKSAVERGFIMRRSAPRCACGRPAAAWQEDGTPVCARFLARGGH